MVAEPPLEVRDLCVDFVLDEGTVHAVSGLSYSVQRGRTLGIVGESGRGKTVTAQSVLGILPRPGRIVAGEIVFHQRQDTPVELAGLDPFGPRMPSIRGSEIAYIFSRADGRAESSAHDRPSDDRTRAITSPGGQGHGPSALHRHAR